MACGAIRAAEGVNRVALVVNPFASRVTDEKVEEVERELARVADVTVLRTEHPRHATELVSDACRGELAAVVVFSGDGGFNEALNGLDGDLPIGFVPGGGASVLPRALGLPTEPVAAAGQIAEAIGDRRVRRITAGRVNGRRFGFSAGVGLDAEAVRRVDEMGRDAEGKRPGDLAFALAVVRVLAENRGRLDPALEIEGLGRAAFAFVANGTPYTYAKGLPLPIVPEADFELGLDVVAPLRIQRRSLIRTAYSLLRGRASSGPVLYGHDLDRIDIRCDNPMPLQADGEDLGDVTEVELTAERGAIAVLV
jgi:diacylglycerol kinase family enzyme